MKYIMSLDQGTTSSRCILFDEKGRVHSLAQETFTQYYPQPGWVEHDASEIWNCQLRVAREAMKKVSAQAADIAAIGITNQRETTVVWDKNTGKPIYHAIVWQCHRTAEYVDLLVAKGCADQIRNKTGLVPDAYFSATKIKWILDHVKGARERAKRGELLFGTIDTWLIWNMTGRKVHITDYTNASRTMLFDIHRLCWDEDLLDLMDIPREILPEVMPSSCVYGVTEENLFGGEIPIAAAVGDQQAALFGQCCFEEGEAKSTYGTGGFLLMNTGDKPVDSHSGLITTIAVALDGKVQYALEGSVFISGAVIQWMRDEMGLIRTSEESETVSLSVESTDGVYLVPSFTGMGAPYWNQYARGCIVGLTRGTRQAHLVRASLESIAYQIRDICLAMEKDAGMKIRSLRVDGGGAKNNTLMQFQSNILDTEIVRPVSVETTALGAAYLAGLAVSYWGNKNDIRKNCRIEWSFTPQMDAEERRFKCDGWNRAIKAALCWADNRPQETVQPLKLLK